MLFISLLMLIDVSFRAIPFQLIYYSIKAGFFVFLFHFADTSHSSYSFAI
jgi:hypothetical protein